MTIHNYPFLFTDRGVWDLSASIGHYHLTLWFTQSLNKRNQTRVANTCPAPLKGTARWGNGEIVVLDAGSTFEEELWRTYSPNAPKKGGDEEDDEEDDDIEDYELEPADVEAFFKDVESWLTSLQANCPVRLAIGGCHVTDDPWHEWSCQRVPDVVFPQLIEFYSTRARPPTDPEARKVDAVERMLAAMTLRLVDVGHQERGLDDPVNAQLASILEKARGYNEVIDSSIDRVLNAMRRR